MNERERAEARDKIARARLARSGNVERKLERYAKGGTARLPNRIREVNGHKLPVWWGPVEERRKGKRRFPWEEKF